MTSEIPPVSETVAELMETMRRIQRLSKEREKDPDFAARRKQDAKRQVLDDASAILRDYRVPKKIVHAFVTGAITATSSVRLVREWMSTPSWMLAIGGNMGVGKSTAAGLWLCELATAAARKGLAPGFKAKQVWYTAVDIAQMGGFDDADRLDALARLDALVIDDLGAEFTDGKGYFLSLLGNLLKKRQENDRRTIITTNLSGRKFHKRYGQRIIERIREGGHFAGVAGPNLRVNTADQREADQHFSETEAPEGRRIVRPPSRAEYRLRIRPLSPRARARRAQLELRFA